MVTARRKQPATTRLRQQSLPPALEVNEQPRKIVGSADYSGVCGPVSFGAQPRDIAGGLCVADQTGSTA